MKESVDKLYIKSPCSNCPFLKSDDAVMLSKDRAKEIIEDSKNETFICHKTVDYSGEKDVDGRSRKQCAGALILAKKTKSKHPFLNLYESMFGEMELKNQDLVADNENQFIEKQV